MCTGVRQSLREEMNSTKREIERLKNERRRVSIRLRDIDYEIRKKEEFMSMAATTIHILNQRRGGK